MSIKNLIDKYLSEKIDNKLAQLEKGKTVKLKYLKVEPIKKGKKVQYRISDINPKDTNYGVKIEDHAAGALRIALNDDKFVESSKRIK